MKAIIIVMLAGQIAIVLIAAWSVLFSRMADSLRGRSRWSGLAIGLIVASGTSWSIGNRHVGQPGADMVMHSAPLLLGMGIMAAMMLIRGRRGLDWPG